MKERMMSLLLELLKDSKRGDRELAKVLGVSQPIITRLRHKLEKSGMIRDYTIVPDLKKMGFELLVINFAKIRPRARKFQAIIFEEVPPKGDIEQKKL